MRNIINTVEQGCHYIIYICIYILIKDGFHEHFVSKANSTVVNLQHVLSGGAAFTTLSPRTLTATQ